jgi:hypothetical protein
MVRASARIGRAHPQIRNIIAREADKVQVGTMIAETKIAETMIGKTTIGKTTIDKAGSTKSKSRQ